MWKDPIVEEVRKARDEYAAQFNYDLEAIFRDLQESERKSGRVIVRSKPRRPVQSTAPVAATPASDEQD